MWFKTHVGLISVQEPVEILIGKSNGSVPQRWWIYARLKLQQEASFKGLFGKGGLSNPVSYLAMFLDDEGCQQAIGECMELIQASITTGAGICDLTQSGDAEAWSPNWNLVQW